MRCKRTGKTEQDLTKMKKKITYKALVVALEKEKAQDFLPLIFSTLSPFSRLSKVWKIAGQISRLFQGFRTLYEPWLHYTGDNDEESSKMQPSLRNDPD